MSKSTPPTYTNPSAKQRGQEKMARIPITIQPTDPKKMARKPSWIRVKANTNGEVTRIKNLLRQHKLHSVCEEASCPNLSECFGHGTATFMIMGDKCTRRCTFCDVAHGRPDPLDKEEPLRLAKAIQDLQLRYVVITSVDRDDLLDGGASHFRDCIRAIRKHSPNTQIEILVPDFRGRMQIALDRLSEAPPDVFNHNVETVPRLYRAVRPGSDYQWSLDLIRQFKARFPHIPSKSGLMVGLGEQDDEIKQTLTELKAADCDRLTLGQYLQPSRFHSPVDRYVTPDAFADFKLFAENLGYEHVASGPLVRSSYHADLQAAGKPIS